MIDDTEVCNSCGDIREITVNKEDCCKDVEAINQNFDVIKNRLEALESKVGSLFDDEGNLDMNGKCIVNIGDCCQPSSLVTKEAINTRLQLIVVGMIQEILKSPEQFLLRAGVKYYAADQRDLDSQKYF